MLNRQAIYWGVAVLWGIAMYAAYLCGYLSPQALAVGVMAFSIIIPMMVLFRVVMELNHGGVYLAWLAIGAVFFVVYLITKDDPAFKLVGGLGTNEKSLFYPYSSDNPMTSAKTLLVFLIVYKIINECLKKITGKTIISISRHRHYDGPRRKITALDVFINLFLLASIYVSVMTR